MEAPTVGIGRLLKEGGRFFIPHHQRDYSWTEDELDQLFQDIEEAQAFDQPEYFIGLMVFMPKAEREFTILDGQQRLATTIIVVAAVRSWLKARGFDEDAHQIQGNYVAVRELGRRDLDPRLVLNENNNDAFMRHVVGESPLEDVKAELASLKRYDPNRRLLEAALYCRQRVADIGSSDGDTSSGAERLFELVRYLENSVKVVRLNVPNEANAYTVFETLNDRGLDLSVLDLVKNHLFGRAAGRATVLRDIQTRWAQMMANLANVRADDFLKTWWISRNGRVQTPQLFTRFKERVSSRGHAGAISKDMLAASEQYAALEIADDPLWSSYSHQARSRVATLKLIGSQQIHAVMLSALKRFDAREMERLLHLLEVLIVRYQLVGGGRTGRLEISCARLAHRIYDGQCNTAAEAAALLKDIMPNDVEFRETFRTKQERNNQKARYLLSHLEIQARRAEEGAVSAGELEPSVSLTLEHVFPKSPEGYWEDLQARDPTFAEDCTYRLGNLCLLTGVNRNLGNKNFGVKKNTFAKSDLLLTRELADFDEWTRRSVENRQATMAKLAVALWRFN